MKFRGEKKLAVFIYPSPAGVENPYLATLLKTLGEHPLVERADVYSPGNILNSPRGPKIIHLQWVLAKSVSQYGAGLRAWLRWLWSNGRYIALLLTILPAKIFMRAKVIWTIHDAPRLDVHPTMVSILRGLHFYLADGYVIHAESARHDIPARYSKKPVIFCHRPNFIDHYGPLATKKEAEEMRKNLNIPAGAVIFLVFGHFKVSKNIERVVDAFHRAKFDRAGAYLLIVGEPFEATTLGNIRKLTAVEPNIIFIPRLVPDHYVRMIIGVSDFVIIGQERGYTSGVMFTAMSYGKPVIIRNWGAAPQYVKDGENGFSFEWDTLPDALKCAVSFSGNVFRYREMCNAARRAMEPLTWENTVETLLPFYQLVYGNNRSA